MQYLVKTLVPDEVARHQTLAQYAEMHLRLREYRLRRGLTQAVAAEALNISEAQLSRSEKGVGPGGSDMPLSRLGHMAELYGCRPEDLVNSDENVVALTNIQIVGEVQAGLWTETYEYPEGDRPSVPVPSFSDVYKSLFGLRICGASMDEFYPEGSVVICAKLFDYPHEVKDGDHVIVEVRDVHGLMEATVKELKRDHTGRLWLHPRSSDPAFHAVPLPDKGFNEDAAGAEDVRVVAVVLGSWVQRA